jgi:hypothetical protein
MAPVLKLSVLPLSQITGRLDAARIIGILNFLRTFFPHRPLASATKMMHGLSWSNGRYSHVEAQLSQGSKEKLVQVKPEIRECCMLLGLANRQVSIASVERAWADKMARLDSARGENLEAMTSLNSAKHFLIRWINDNPSPNIDWSQGDSDDPNQPSGVPRRPLPSAGSSAIALPLPESDEGAET